MKSVILLAVLGCALAVPLSQSYYKNHYVRDQDYANYPYGLEHHEDNQWQEMFKTNPWLAVKYYRQQPREEFSRFNYIQKSVAVPEQFVQWEQFLHFVQSGLVGVKIHYHQGFEQSQWYKYVQVVENLVSEYRHLKEYFQKFEVTGQQIPQEIQYKLDHFEREIYNFQQEFFSFVRFQNPESWRFNLFPVSVEYPQFFEQWQHFLYFFQYGLEGVQTTYKYDFEQSPWYRFVPIVKEFINQYRELEQYYQQYKMTGKDFSFDFQSKVKQFYYEIYTFQQEFFNFVQFHGQYHFENFTTEYQHLFQEWEQFLHFVRNGLEGIKFTYRQGFEQSQWFKYFPIVERFFEQYRELSQYYQQYRETGKFSTEFQTKVQQFHHEIYNFQQEIFSYFRFQNPQITEVMSFSQFVEYPQYFQQWEQFLTFVQYGIEGVRSVYQKDFEQSFWFRYVPVVREFFNQYHELKQYYQRYQFVGKYFSVQFQYKVKQFYYRIFDFQQQIFNFMKFQYPVSHELTFNTTSFVVSPQQFEEWEQFLHFVQNGLEGIRFTYKQNFEESKWYKYAQIVKKFLQQYNELNEYYREHVAGKFYTKEFQFKVQQFEHEIFNFQREFFSFIGFKHPETWQYKTFSDITDYQQFFEQFEQFLNFVQYGIEGIKFSHVQHFEQSAWYKYITIVKQFFVKYQELKQYFEEYSKSAVKGFSFEFQPKFKQFYYEIYNFQQEFFSFLKFHGEHFQGFVNVRGDFDQTKLFEQWKQYLFFIQSGLESFKFDYQPVEWKKYVQIVKDLIFQLDELEKLHQKYHVEMEAPQEYRFKVEKFHEQFLHFFQEFFASFFNQHKTEFVNFKGSFDYPEYLNQWENFFRFVQHGLEGLKETENFEKSEWFKYVDIVKNFLEQIHKLKETYQQYRISEKQIPYEFQVAFKKLQQEVYQFQQFFQTFFQQIQEHKQIQKYVQNSSPFFYRKFEEFYQQPSREFSIFLEKPWIRNYQTAFPKGQDYQRYSREFTTPFEFQYERKIVPTKDVNFMGQHQTGYFGFRPFNY